MERQLSIPDVLRVITAASFISSAALVAAFAVIVLVGPKATQ